MTLQDGVSSSANGTRTCAKIDTPLTQRRSGDVPVTDLGETNTDLIALRNKHGAQSASVARLLEASGFATRPICSDPASSCCGQRRTLAAKARISGFRRIPQKHSARTISRLCRAKPSPISVSGRPSL
jgi:hypothetical protein